MTAFQALDEAAAAVEHVAEPPPHSVTPPLDEPADAAERDASGAERAVEDPVDDAHIASQVRSHSSLALRSGGDKRANFGHHLAKRALIADKRRGRDECCPG